MKSKGLNSKNGIGFFVGAAFLYVALTALMYVKQRSLMYFPDTFKTAPLEDGVPDMTIARVSTADGLTLEGWYKPPSSSDQPVLVFFHGNGGSLRGRGFVARPFLEAGYGFLFAEYRGYGGNPGQPTEQGLFNDARAYTEWLLKNEGIRPEQIVFFGESMGTGVAARMASEYKSAAALILLSPFTSFTDVARGRYGYLPVGLLIKDRFDSLSVIGAVHMPLLILHGRKDTIVPFRLGQALYEAAPGPKELAIFPDAGHNDMYQFGALARIIDYLQTRKAKP